MATAKQLWNQTYVQGMSEHTESSLDTVYNRLSQRPIKYPTDCGVMCRRIHNHLSTMGVKSHILSGQFIGGYNHNPDSVEPPLSREHIWLKVDNNIIDPTASQYNHHVDEFKPEHYKEYEAGD